MSELVSKYRLGPNPEARSWTFPFRGQSDFFGHNNSVQKAQSRNYYDKIGHFIFLKASQLFIHPLVSKAKLLV
jgi:hypothetical protein